MALVRRDRTFVIVGLTGLTVVSWIYLLVGAWGMDAAAGPRARGLTALLMPAMTSWGLVDLILLFVMWAVMMAAMMTPSVTPFVLVFTTLRRKRAGSEAVGSAAVLLLGYLIAWTGFSVLATLAQWALHEAALLSPMMVSVSPFLGGILLVAAGIFQLTPLKRACLVHCRSPLAFLMSEWRPGHRGALVMGLRHGAYCVGCCWALMALLFVAGVMNLLWVAALAAFVLVEKVAPGGELAGRLAGFALIAVGIAVMVGVPMG